MSKRFAGAGRNRTADKGFADLVNTSRMHTCLAVSCVCTCTALSLESTRRQFAAPSHCTFVCGIGDTEMIDEMTVRPTARGQKWRESLSRLKSSERAINAVRLTIENHPKHDDVGGDVDAVLVSTHGLKWVRKKERMPHRRKLIFARS